MREVDKLASATRSEKSIVSILPIGVGDRSAFPSDRRLCRVPIATPAPQRRANPSFDNGRCPDGSQRVEALFRAETIVTLSVRAGHRVRLGALTRLAD